MGVPLFIGDLAGTSLGEFSLGKDGHSIKKIDDVMGYEDPINGESKFAQLDTLNAVITTDGGIVYDDVGQVVLEKV